MAKSEKARTIDTIKRYFKVGDRISRRKFEKLLLEDDSTLIENSLIAFLETEIDNIMYQDDFTYLFNALRYIEVLIEKYPDLNRKKLKRKLTKLSERVDFIKQERKVQKRIEKFNEIIYSLENKLDVYQNNYYELFSYFLFEIKSTSYIEKIIKFFPNIVNVKDKDNNSIFYEVINTYITTLLESDKNDDALYYNSLISLLKSRKEFSLDNVEKTKCLQLIYDGIGDLSKSCDDYKQKLNALSDLKSMLTNDLLEKDIRDMGKYYNIKIYSWAYSIFLFPVTFIYC